MNLSTNDFIWDPDTRTFSIEASLLPRSWRRTDELLIRSARTGNVMSFFPRTTVKDADGDIVCWTFKPADRDDITVVVYND